MEKKYIYYALIALGIIVLWYLLAFRGSGDWIYKPERMPERTILFWVLAIPAAVILAYLALSILMIVKGKPKSYKRRTGIALLIMPFLVAAILAVSIITESTAFLIATLIVIGLIALGSLIITVYSIIRREWLALSVSVFALLILAIPLIMFMTNLGVLNPGRYMDNSMALSSGMQARSSAESLGFSVGGAKDINNFRENIKNGYLPLPTDLTYEGLFYDYYFDTGQAEECKDLFCPSYMPAISKDPLSNKTDYYLSVGLNSGIKAEDFKRKKLNLVIVMDISGSMDSPFNKYYYDGASKEETSRKRKIEIARESVADMLSHLERDDSFGMVLFESTGHNAKMLGPVREANMLGIKNEILRIESTGGTNFEAGYKLGTEMFDGISIDPDIYENRIIFLTDAMPNTGQLSEDKLFGMTSKNAGKGVYTTFIGVGVDFNTELIEYITKIRGANYYSVHSEKEFQKRLDDEFEFMVTPLVFNLNLILDAPGYEILKVYGSPEADDATGVLMHVNTLFPSATSEEGTKGGIVLLKLRKKNDDGSMRLRVSYEDRNGKEGSTVKEFSMPSSEPESFGNNGIRKAVLLSRYADLMKNWIIDERAKQPEDRRVSYINGILVPPEIDMTLSRWERTSSQLSVSDEYKRYILLFNAYYLAEMQLIGDETLKKESELMISLAE